MNLILASSSKYRKAQLAKLGLDFTSYSPNIDESAQNGESASALAIRLAQTKARSVQAKFKHSIVIGSDQVAYANQQILGKPKTYDNAYQQLASFSQQKAIFYTAVCVTDGINELTELIPTECKFIELGQSQIQHYLKQDQPYDTAGSAKIEALGIALMEYVRSDDPSALIGLPLIALCRMLRQFGIDPLKPAND